MKTPQTFKINVLLPVKQVNIQTLIDDVFNTIKEQLTWCKEQSSRKEEYDNMLAENEKQKNTAKVTLNESGVLLSFDVRNFSEEFSLENQEGYRPWLRSYLDQTFFHYLNSGLAMYLLKYVLENQVEPPSNDKFLSLQNAFKKVFMNENSFWIEGEEVSKG